MKDLIEYVAKSLTVATDKVTVTETTDELGITVFRLEVAPEDKGRIIGRHGRVAEAMRIILRGASAKAGIKARLEIV